MHFFWPSLRCKVIEQMVKSRYLVEFPAQKKEPKWLQNLSRFKKNSSCSVAKKSPQNWTGPCLSLNMVRRKKFIKWQTPSRNAKSSFEGANPTPPSPMQQWRPPARTTIVSRTVSGKIPPCLTGLRLQDGGIVASSSLGPTRRKRSCYFSPFLQLPGYIMCTPPGQAPSSWLPWWQCSLGSTLYCLIAIVYLLPCLRLKICGTEAFSDFLHTRMVESLRHTHYGPSHDSAQTHRLSTRNIVLAALEWDKVLQL